MKRTWPVVLLGMAACGSDPIDPCEGVAGVCLKVPVGADHREIQTMLLEVEPGETVAFPPGRWRVDGELSLTVPGVTIKGSGMDRSILSFAGQTVGAQGMLITGDDFTIQDLGLEDSPGDLLKIEGVNGVTIRRVRAEWTRGPHSGNGAYGLYPVQCQNVLIEGSVAIAASDAGIYVGQSDNIVVTGNRAEQNVAGIEIENSTRADVFANEAVGNTGGVLVFNLPGLPMANGSGTRVFDNHIHANNEPNFAPIGNIVGKVPTGTGIAILAAREIEIFGNTIEHHKSVNLGIISYTTTEIAFDDPRYDPDPDTIWIHDNVFRGTSDEPTGPLGALLILTLAEVQGAAVVVPDIVWDGVVPADKAVDPKNPVALQPALNICLRNNGDADFANLHWPDGTPPPASFDATPHDCAHPSLPAVVLE
jgi:parallel beta-helix repeat protein